MTLVGAARVGPCGRVISSEPSPATADLLRRNVRANSFDWVAVEQSAVGDATGRAELFEFEAGAGLHSLAPEVHAGSHTIAVDVVRIDDLAQGLPGLPALVKLDVEGAEVKALRGARQLLAFGRTTFIVEVEARHLERQGATLLELQDYFAGYEPHVIFSGGSTFEMRPWRGPWDALPDTPNLVLLPMEDR
jgi:FkbM family methyltransferase